MSTRKSTLASPTAQGTKLENASTSSTTTHTTKSLEKTNASSPTADRIEMGANASSNAIIVNTIDPKATEQIQKTNQDTKPFLQRVTRNSPLLLASPHSGLTIKKEPLDPNEHHTNSESEEVGGSNTTTNIKKTNIRGRKSLKEHKELAEKEEDLEAKEKEDIVKETKEEQTEKKEPKEQIEQKDTATSPVQPTTTASNRLTRKSVANQEAANTRITRQRQSSGASARSETPPARSRSGRCIGRGKMPVPMIDSTPAVTKRKRSVDVDNNTSVNKSTIDEPGPKYIKIEVKDPDIDNEEVLLSSQNTNASSESTDEPTIKIKQELVEESENEMPATTESNATTVNTSTVTTNAGRGKGNRGGTRKSTSNTSTTSTSNNSPSTRATRQTKQTSPVQSNTTTETKRRRMGSQTRSLLKTNAGSNSKNQPANGEDEDSKDSVASSTNTDDIVLALIKSEKISMELDDDNTNDAKEQHVTAENEVIKTVVAVTEESSDLPPLVIDTDVAPSTSVENVEIVESAAALTPVAASCSSVASGSEKAASLSPSELLSEGVSEISVKQFYKKPKFLENNLGIEEDPKLGNIVQKVAGLEPTTTVTATTPALSTVAAAIATTAITTPEVHILDDSYSNESLKEGTLRFDESIEDKKSTSQDDNNSLSSGGNLTPLLIVEDDDDVLQEEIEIKEKVAKNPETMQKEKSLQNTATRHETLSDVVEKANVKLNIIDVEDEDTERDLDQEDELTLEESETISMDNNASINDEVVTEIEDTATEENITEIEDSTDVTEVIQKHNKQDDTDAPTLQVKIKTSLNESCDIVEDNDELTKLELITNDKENSPSTNIATDVNSPVVSAHTTAEDEDNDVLAKIDAELKKIDERSKEKLTTKRKDKLEIVLVMDTTEDNVKNSIENVIVSNESMDFDGDVKLSDEDEATNITKDEAIDDVLDIKLDDEQSLIIAEDIKLLDDKDKADDEEDVGIGSDMDSLLKEEKMDIKDNLIKTSSSDIEIEALNGKPTSSSSLGSSPIKLGLTLIKDDDTTSMKSGQSATSWVTLDLENDDEDTLRKKELHLQNLGLVTHKAAEKRRLEVIQSSAANVEASKVATQQQHNKRNGKNSSHAASTHHEYTGTLKTIIKINRNSTGGSTSGSNGRKTQNNTAGSSTSKEQQQRRQSLKMTFQKGRARAHGTGNNDRTQQDREGHGEDSYYTIQNETEESHDHVAGVSTKKDEKEKILIPEKASSFKFHPGRLCEDQCFYCSGKFGLYDTPCHVGQIKSMERQQKILANEEKLTVDNCLCDACFRHVDRRANVPSYKKRLSASGNIESLASTSSKSTESQQYDDQHNAETEGGDSFSANAPSRKCLVPDCVHPAAHSLRRKCIRKSVKKFLLKFEIPAGAASVWLCQSHYDTVIQCSGCVLCKRRLGKNHMYHITSDTDRLEKALCEMGIPVQLGIGTAVCKLCRYFANLLMKPPDSTKSQKAEFVKNYRKRLLQFHNIHDGSNDASEADEDDSNSNSASNHDNNELQEKTDSMPQENETSVNAKDTAKTSEDQLAEKLNSNANNDLEENTRTNTLQHDFETAGMSSDSSNSSSASNTASNSPNEMSKLKAILQSNASAEKQPSADISNVLRANPNISMRELFPGEEDLGLHFKAPFSGNNSQRTPEGWTRVQTFLQYDEPTRRLWEELQKPYGNQSSFLRHLILLEKYFRNGDLVLSASASTNASVYTQTVKQRLTSYDKGHCGGLHMGTGTPKENTTSGSSSSNTTKSREIDPKIPTFVINEDDDEEDSEGQDVEMTEVDKLSKSSSSMLKDSNASNQNKHQLQRSRSLSVDKLTKQLSSNAVTITARPKDPASLANIKRATPSPQKSLLKDNLMAASANTLSSSTSANLAAANAAAAVALAASTASAGAGGPSNSRSILKCNLLGINKSVEILPLNNATTTTITKSSSNLNAPPLPPPPPAPIPPVPETKQQKILDVANKLLGNHLEAAAANQNKNQVSLLSSPPELVSLQRRSTGQVMPVAASTNNSQQAGNLVKRPQLLAKPGTSRPPPNVVILPDTLTPQERLQSKTWRPTLMPVEENQNLLNKNGPLYQTADGRRLPALVQVQSGGKPFLISIFDYNRMCILRREKLMRDQMLKATKKRQEAKQQQQQQQQAQVQQQHQHQQQQQQQQHLQNQQQQQQQQQFQKTNLQNINKNYQTSSAAVNQRQQQVAQQQLLQLQLLQHQQALFKAAAAANNSSNSQNPPRYQTIAPKPATSNITSMPPLQAPINTNANFTTPMMPLLANAITNAANTGTVNPASSSINNTSWLWNNFPDANQLLLNGGATTGGANVPKLPQLLAKPNNSATTLTNVNNAMKQQQQQQQQHQQQQYLLSKIPKSLTVIPQHKLMHNNGAAGAASGNTGGNLMKE